MTYLRYLFLLPLVVAYAGAASAQEIPLEQLEKLASLPPDLPLEKMTTVLLPAGWTYRGHVGNTEEVYWTAGEEVTLDGEPFYEAWLSLRPMPGRTMDVLYKAIPGVGFEALHREVRHQKYPVEPVTCIECEGLRYTTGAHTLAFYEHKKRGYPCIMVLHQLSVSK